MRGSRFGEDEVLPNWEEAVGLCRAWGSVASAAWEVRVLPAEAPCSAAASRSHGLGRRGRDPSGARCLCFVDSPCASGRDTSPFCNIPLLWVREWARVGSLAGVPVVKDSLYFLVS